MEKSKMTEKEAKGKTPFKLTLPKNKSRNPIKKLSHNQAHIYFYALPVGTKFLHQGDRYKKISDNCVVDSKGNEWVMESHYGCIIGKKMAQELGIKKSDHRPIEYTSATKKQETVKNKSTKRKKGSRFDYTLDKKKGILHVPSLPPDNEVRDDYFKSEYPR